MESTSHQKGENSTGHSLHLGCPIIELICIAGDLAAVIPRKDVVVGDNKEDGNVDDDDRLGGIAARLLWRADGMLVGVELGGLSSCRLLGL